MENPNSSYKSRRPLMISQLADHIHCSVILGGWVFFLLVTLWPMVGHATPASNTESGEVYSNAPLSVELAADVSAMTGSMQYQYEIDLPPGRNDFSPTLTFNYDSGDRDQFSYLGYGWKLSIPYITRTNKFGSERLYTTNHFLSSLDGELVEGAEAIYQAKVSTGPLKQYSYDSNQWVVQTSLNTALIFGANNGRIENETGSTTYRWFLSEERDSNGNAITYTYTRQGNQVYPQEIRYGGDAAASQYSVRFTYATRPNVVSYEAGFPIITDQQLKQVDVYFGTTKIKSYNFSYTEGTNGTRQLLSSITEAVPQLTLPPTKFTYSTMEAGEKTWEEDTALQLPEKIINERQSIDLGVRMFDVNGDGLTDVVKYNNARLKSDMEIYPVQKVYLNKGKGWELTSDWTLPAPKAHFAFVGFDPDDKVNIDLGARFADVNGDGFTDILWGLSRDGNGYYNYNFGKVFVNNREGGWAEAVEYLLPQDIRFNTDSIKGGAEIIDVNGDGLPDLVAAARWTSNGGGSFSYHKKTYLNTGSSWEASPTWVLPEIIYDQGSDAGLRFVDLNGDGLVDFVRHVDTVYNDQYPADSAYLNTGSGWVKADPWRSPFPFVLHDHGLHSLSTRFLDVNSDGLPDLLAHERGPAADNKKVLINTGNGWQDKTSKWNMPELSLFNFSYQNNGVYWTADTGVRPIDVDGDNMLDFVKWGPFDYPIDTHDKAVLIHQGAVPDLLATIDDRRGGKTDIKYTQTTQYTTQEGELANPILPTVIDTVSAVTYDSGVDQPTTNTFSYASGSIYYKASDVRDRRFAGFGKVSKTTPLGTETQYYHQGDGDMLPEEQEDHEAKIGLAYKKDVGEVLSEHTYYTSTALATGTTFVAPKIEISAAKGNETKLQAYTYHYTKAGNVARKDEFGEVQENAEEVFTDIAGDGRVFKYEYASTQEGKETSYPSSKTVLPEAGEEIAAHTKYFYDGQPAGEVSKGNLTAEVAYSAFDEYQTTGYTYNQVGNLLSEQDPNGNVTHYEYDTHKLHPIKIINPLGQQTSLTYDYRSGEVVNTIDPAGTTRRSEYDGLGRIQKTYLSHPQSGQLVLTSSYAYNDTPGSVAVDQTIHRDTMTTTNHQYLDGFGRPIQEKIQTDAGYRTTDTAYGSNSLVVANTLPYIQTDPSRTAPSSDETKYTRYSYDPLQRVTKVASAVGTTDTAYDGWVETTTDPNEVSKTLKYDAFGRLHQVDEKNEGEVYTTTYTYDVLDNLTRITDANNNERTIAYDWLSRRTKLEDIHDPTDKTFAIWEFAYDKAGNLVNETLPDDSTVQYNYDSLNRIQTENHSDSNAYDQSYSYDSCANGMGKLCLVSSTALETAYVYDRSGNVSSETIKLDGQSFTSSRVFNQQGEVTAQVYPDNGETTYELSESGQLAAVTYTDPQGGAAAIITKQQYSPNGKVAFREYGNGSEERREYDPSELYRLKKITISAYPAPDLPPATSTPTTTPTTPQTNDDIRKQDLTTLTTALNAYYTDHNTYKIPAGHVNNAGTPTGYGWVSYVCEGGDCTYPQSIAGYLHENGYLDQLITDPSGAVDNNWSLGKAGYMIDTSAGDHFTIWANLDTPTNEDLATQDTCASSLFDDYNQNSPSEQRMNYCVFGGSQPPQEPIPADTDDELRKQDLLDLATALEQYYDDYGTYQVAAGFENASGVTKGNGWVSYECIDEEGCRYKISVARYLKEEGFTDRIVIDPSGETKSSSATGKTGYMIDTSAGDHFTIWANLDTPTNEDLATLDTCLNDTFDGYHANYPEERRINYCVSGSRSTVSDDEQRRTDLTTLTTALNAYYTDHNTYKIPAGHVNNAGTPTGYGWVSYVCEGGDCTYPQSIAGYLHENGYLDQLITDPSGAVDNNWSLGKAGYMIDTSAGDHFTIWANLDTPTNEDLATQDTCASSLFDDYNQNSPSEQRMNYCVFGGSLLEDSERKADLEKIATALEAHYSDLGTYKVDAGYVNKAGSTTGNGWVSYSCEGEADCTYPLAVDEYLFKQGYLDEFVTDPSDEEKSGVGSGRTGYMIETVMGDHFTIWANLALPSAADLDTLEDCLSDRYDNYHTNYPEARRINYCISGEKPLAVETADMGVQVAAISLSEPASEEITATTSSKLSESATTTEQATDKSVATTSSAESMAVSEEAAELVASSATKEKTSATTTDSSINSFESASLAPLEESMNAAITDLEATVAEMQGLEFDFTSSSSEGSLQLTGQTESNTLEESSTYSSVSLTNTTNDSGSLPKLAHTLVYTYDPVGNVTQLSEATKQGTFQTQYSYDDLYRLTETTSDHGYSRVYTYDPIGNITSKSDLGAYAYQETNGANPHAVTNVAGTKVTYDPAGNMTSYDDRTYESNYKNQLVQTSENGQTITYVYDHTGRRVKKSVDGVATYYPSSDYELSGTTSTTHIYANDGLAATVAGGDIEYAHLDHLGSTRYMSDASGTISQVYDYYPFGAERTSEQHSDTSQTNRYTGHDYDEETDLSYMGARYQSGDTGRFTSQDPVSLALGDWGTVQDKTGDKIGFYLKNPQSHNSYSYAFNNPIKYVDQNGEFAWVPVLVVGGILLESFLTDVNVAQAPSANSDLSAAPDSTTIGASFAGDVNNPGIANTVVYGLSIMKPDPMDAKKILNSWNPGTFPNKMQSIRYHLSKHGQGRSMSEYTSDGQKFYNNYANTGVDHKLRNGDVGVKITNKENNYFGIYDSSGKQVTHGAIDKKKEFSVD